MEKPFKRLKDNMRLKIKKLGPINDSELEIGDITLLLGPPNTGKSYTLKAIYAKLLPLDGYALKELKRKLTNFLMNYLERKLVVNTVPVTYNLFKKIINFYILLLFKRVKSYDNLRELVSLVSKEDEIKVKIKRYNETSILLEFKTPAIILYIKKDTIRHMLRETINEFVAELIPSEYIKLISFEPEPIDLTALDLDFTVKNMGFKIKMNSQRLSLLSEELFDYLIHYVVKEFNLEFKQLSSLQLLSLINYLRQLMKFFRIEISLKMNSRPGQNKMKLSFNVNISARLDMNSLPALEKTVSDIKIEIIKQITDKAFKNASEDIKFHYIINNITRTVSYALREEFLEFISRNIIEKNLYDVARSRLGQNDLRFIPFGRSILMLGIESASREPYTRSEFLRSFINEFYPNVLASFVFWASKGRSLLLEGKLSDRRAKLLNAATPLIEGKLRPNDSGKLLYHDWRNSIVDFQFSSALVEEVSGLIFTLLTVEENSIILIEEPEAQLHPGAQIVMALFLASLPTLCKCRVVTSTHSDLLAITLSQLVEQKPNKYQVKELIERLLPHLTYVKEEVDVLADALSKSIRNLNLRIYEFTREGIVKSVKPIEVLNKEVPGISTVIDELTDWAFRLASHEKE